MSTITKKPLPKTLKALVDDYVPKSISNDKEHDKALKLMERLMGLPKLTKGQATYLNTLCDLVQVYEEKHHKIDTSDITELDMLKFFMEDRKMSTEKLCEILGVSPSVCSKIFNGQMKLTPDHIGSLAKYFRTSPDVFSG